MTSLDTSIVGSVFERSTAAGVSCTRRWSNDLEGCICSSVAWRSECCLLQSSRCHISASQSLSLLLGQKIALKLVCSIGRTFIEMMNEQKVELTGIQRDLLIIVVLMCSTGTVGSFRCTRLFELNSTRLVRYHLLFWYTVGLSIRGTVIWYL